MSRPAPHSRSVRHPHPRPRIAGPKRWWREWGLSFVLAGALGLVLYLVATSVPYFAQVPSTDERFGRLNSCLLEEDAGPRLGFAVSTDAQRIATYGSRALIVCEQVAKEGARDVSPGADERSTPSGIPGRRTGERAREALAGFDARGNGNGDFSADRETGRTLRTVGGDTTVERLDFPNVQAAAFDGEDGLWFYTSAPPGLWHRKKGADVPVKLAELPLMGLVGHPDGALVLEHPSHLMAFTTDGRLAGQTELPAPVAEHARLSMNANGRLAAMATGGGLVVLRTKDAEVVRAEAPCEVDRLWWEDSEVDVRLACLGATEVWAMRLNVLSGAAELSELPTNVEAQWAWSVRSFLESCDGLPCSVPSL